MGSQSAKLQTAQPPFVISNAFNDMQVLHGFFGRAGGVSEGPYESLNAGFNKNDDGDPEGNVVENRRRIARALNLPADRLFALNQDHTTQCWSIGEGSRQGTATIGDAMVTNKPNTGLGVLTADCAPVLFHADSSSIEAPWGVIGAAHAGHKGARAGVLESTVLAMRDFGVTAEDITAVIGPCIGPDSYEVSKGFEEPFLREDEAAGDYFHAAATPAKLMFDLPGYVIHRLKRIGLKNISWVGVDTLPAETGYFSHRRTTMSGETRRGLQMSVIRLKHS